MKYTTIIFDLDGTLLDTLDDLAAATNYALKANGLPLRTTDEVRRFVGNGIGNLIKRAVPANTSVELQEQVFAAFNKYYKLHSADRTKPYDGIMELLEKLRQQSCQTAIVSNKADYAVQDLAKEYFPGLMDAACGERSGISRKPAPDSVLAIMQQLNADPKTTIYIGDSDVDIATAKNAGIPCIGACWGFRGKEFLLEHGAELLADAPQDVYDLLK